MNKAFLDFFFYSSRPEDQCVKRRQLVKKKFVGLCPLVCLGPTAF